MTGSILTLNAGSSSLKFAMFDEATTAPTTLSASVRGEIERLDAGPHLRAWDSTGDVLTERRWPSGLADAFTVVLGELLAFADAQPASKALIAVGHRVVHGGPDHRAPERVTPAVLSALQALIPLDPLHMPHSLAPIVAIAAARPDLAQVVCFDTAFHPARGVRRRHPALWVPWPVLRVYRLEAAGRIATLGEGAGHRRASGVGR